MSRWIRRTVSVGPEQVKVVYEFTNHAKDDQDVLVAFPLPDITGDGDFMVAIPHEDDHNLFGFTTTFDGKPVESTLHQYAFAIGVDQTELPEVARRAARAVRQGDDGCAQQADATRITRSSSTSAW